MAHLVLEAQLLEEDGHLVAVGRAGGIEVDVGLGGHLEVTRNPGEAAGHIQSSSNQVFNASASVYMYIRSVYTEVVYRSRFQKV